jgi:glucosamine--fructose-6-phosphate aminotransferase (isomerizing)
MCGIVGYLGDHQAAPILLDSLRRLEYRGYDSAGIATLDGGRLDRRRAEGKLVGLSDLLVTDPLPGRTGIGHTRWATHGAPVTRNAHPHRSGPVAVVHNGIVENWRELRAELPGWTFETDTDTEVVAALTAHALAEGASPVEAAIAVVDRLEGAFALALLFEGEDDLIIAARRGPPLALGHGEGEMYVGSDAVALAPLTARISHLEDGDVAVVARAGAVVLNGGREVERPVVRIDGVAAVDKGGHRHFMAKEIAEQPAAIRACLDAYADGVPVPFEGISRVSLSACGTGYLACAVARHWFEALAGLPCDLDVASELRYREPPVEPGTLAVMLSQSGETADTLAALRYMKGRAASVVGVVNAAESTIAREADVVLPIHVGPEIGVASTKAFTGQLAVLALMALEAAGRPEERLAELGALPGLVNAALGCAGDVEAIAGEIAAARDVLFIGRGPMAALALEGALKLKEISYIHAEGYPAGELKHGPIALVDAEVPVVVMAPSGPLFDKTASNMQEVMARGGRVVLVSDEDGIARAGEGVWRTIRLPRVPAWLAPIVHAVPVQLLAYHAAVAKGTDVDQPRNLAKSVTVE